MQKSAISDASNAMEKALPYDNNDSSATNIKFIDDSINMVKDGGAFDLNYYRGQIGNEVISLTDAIAHYLSHGWKSGLNPHPYFDTDFYLRTNPDVPASGVNPLVHFVKYGYKEKRQVKANFNLEPYYKINPDLRDFSINPLKFLSDASGKFADLPPELSSLMSQGEYENILLMKLFDDSFYVSTYADIHAAKVDPFAHYIFSGWRENRNPSIYFDTQYYLRTYPDIDFCPLLHYVRFGQAEGRRATAPYTVPFSPAKLSISSGYQTASRVAVHAHIFYPETVNDLCCVLRNVPYPFDVLVSTTTEANADFILRSIQLNAAAEKVIVKVVRNIGRDIAPMLIGFRDMWQQYEYICHVHSKKSLHAGFGDKWRYYLYDQLLGSRNAISTIIKELDDNPNLGLLFPDNFVDAKPFVAWAGNLPAARRLLHGLGLDQTSLEDTWEFPAGSMCWMRARAMHPLLGLTLDDFTEEDGEVEGTLAHVIERCLIHVAAAQGYSYRKYIMAAQDVEWTRSAPSYPPPKAITVVGERWIPDSISIATHPRYDLEPLNRTFNPAAVNIHWIVPDFGRGQGGHMTIFRLIYFLDRFGHRQTVWIRHAHLHRSEDEAKKKIQNWYQPISDRVIVRFLPNDVSGISGDAVIATDGWTVYPVMNMTLFKERFYLVQDHEVYFHARGTKYFLMENTYRMGLKALCAGKWLYGIVTEKYGQWARSWDLAYDSSIYHPKPKAPTVAESSKSRHQPRIAFYARQHTERRAVDLGLAALTLLYNEGVNFHVDLFGAELTLSPPYPHTLHGVLQPKELANLYCNCTIGIVFSGTNYSLIPMEMMACELPVVELDAESARAVFPEDAVEYATPDPFAIAEAIKGLLRSEERRGERIAAGRKFIAGLDWEKSARTMEAGLLEGLSVNNVPSIPAKIGRTKSAAKYKASVLIPTFNAGPLFDKVLKRVVTQDTPWQYEVLVIDSGSTDGTIDTVRRYEGYGVRFHEIPNSEFQHGRTRNLGISMTSGEFVAILTQDATPADEKWLHNLVEAFGQSDLIAGVFGKHLPYQDASPFVKRDIRRHFHHFDLLPRVVSWSKGLPTHIPYGTEQWQQNLHFYSDNNACLRRTVWEKVPYPEIEWGEDQVWAWEIIKQGYEKAYAPDAVVYHSHNLKFEEQLKVAKCEGEMFARYFNYSGPLSRTEVENAIEEANRQDEEFARKNDVPDAELKVQKMLNSATIIGRFLGKRSVSKFSRARR